MACLAAGGARRLVRPRGARRHDGGAHVGRPAGPCRGRRVDGRRPARTARPPKRRVPRHDRPRPRRPGRLPRARAPRGGGAHRPLPRARDPAVDAAEGVRARARPACAVRLSRRAAAPRARVRRVAAGDHRVAGERPPIEHDTRGLGRDAAAPSRRGGGAHAVRRLRRADGDLLGCRRRPPRHDHPAPGRQGPRRRRQGAARRLSRGERDPAHGDRRGGCAPQGPAAEARARGAGARRRPRQEGVLGGAELEPRVRHLLRAERVAALGRARRRIRPCSTTPSASASRWPPR